MRQATEGWLIDIRLLSECKEQGRRNFSIMLPETGLFGKCAWSLSVPDFSRGQRSSLFSWGSFGVSESILSFILGPAVWAYSKKGGFGNFYSMCVHDGGAAAWGCQRSALGVSTTVLCFCIWERIIYWNWGSPAQHRLAGQHSPGLLISPLPCQWDYMGARDPDSGSQAWVGNSLLTELPP